MEVDLGGRVAVVTGGAGAIGRAIARRLAESAATVVLADIDAAGARAAAADLPGAWACRIDIAEEASIGDGVAAIRDRFGRIDVLVNNAGVNTLEHRVPVDAFPVAEWERVRRIDLDGPFLMTRAAVGAMSPAGGAIVNIGSVVGLAAMRLQSPFVAAKAGLAHLTRSMALELGPRGIRVNAVAPGSVLSPLTRRLFYDPDGSFSAQAEAFMRHIPLGRPAEAEEIAEAVLFLASPASGYVSGQVLAVDGGWTAGFMI